MEKADAATLTGKQPGAIGRLFATAAFMAAIGLLIGLGVSGIQAGLGVAIGSLAAGLYAWAYVHSHLTRAGRERMLDKPLIRQTGFRILLLALVGAGIWLIGREAFIGYLIGFGLAFAILLIIEAPKVTRALKSRGML